MAVSIYPEIIILNVNRLNSDQNQSGWMDTKRIDPYISAARDSLQSWRHTQKVRGWKKVLHINEIRKMENQWDKIDFKTKL